MTRTSVRQLPIRRVAEVADALGVSSTRVRQMIAAGRLRATNLGGPGDRPFYVVTNSDLEAFVAEPRRPGRPQKEIRERLRALDAQAAGRTGRQSGGTGVRKRDTKQARR